MENNKRKSGPEAAEKKSNGKKRSLIVACAAVVLAAAAWFLVTRVIVPNSRYNAAAELAEEGKYEEAIAAFEALDGYKDSAQKAEECRTLARKARYADVSVGSTIKFGRYEQDNDPADGAEEIEWTVLAVEDGKALVLSKYVLDSLPYNTSYASVSWETCTMRGWLNETFYEAAFDSDEKEMILDSAVTMDTNPLYNTPPGNDTTDKVFLLNLTEANLYLSSEQAKQCAPTDYAVAQGADITNGELLDGRTTCWWWLRSPGINVISAANVRPDGFVYNSGHGVGRKGNGVRPALWVDLG